MTRANQPNNDIRVNLTRKYILHLKTFEGIGVNIKKNRRVSKHLSRIVANYKHILKLVPVSFLLYLDIYQPFLPVLSRLV